MLEFLASKKRLNWTLDTGHYLGRGVGGGGYGRTGDRTGDITGDGTGDGTVSSSSSSCGARGCYRVCTSVFASFLRLWLLAAPAALTCNYTLVVWGGRRWAKSWNGGEGRSGKCSQIRLNFCLAPCGFFGDVFCCFFPQLGLGRSCMYVLVYINCLDLVWFWWKIWSHSSSAVGAQCFGAAAAAAEWCTNAKFCVVVKIWACGFGHGFDSRWIITITWIPKFVSSLLYRSCCRTVSKQFFFFPREVAGNCWDLVVELWSSSVRSLELHKKKSW